MGLAQGGRARDSRAGAGQAHGDNYRRLDPGLLLFATFVVGALAKSGASASAAGVVGAAGS
ncbi:MAG: hypothetical protein QOD83_1910 [Solirubrobacteraceae bacterium]|jgi:hypothetical protein|nr:hypothetical protein [Solirubrobacteraceae bacterium]